MKIALLGHTGFIGSAVYSALKDKHEVTGFNSESTISLDEVDVIVNCAGFSSKYTANTLPELAMEQEKDIITKCKHLYSSKIIHISSVDVMENSCYGRMKCITEQHIKDLFFNPLILRLPGIIGPGLKKNIVFDLQEKRKIYLTEDSFLNFISTWEIARIISEMLDKDRWTTGTINLIASEGIRVKEIARLFKYEPEEWGTEKQDYSMLDSGLAQLFWNTKSSREYILEYLNAK